MFWGRGHIQADTPGRNLTFLLDQCAGWIKRIASYFINFGVSLQTKFILRVLSIFFKKKKQQRCSSEKYGKDLKQSFELSGF